MFESSVAAQPGSRRTFLLVAAVTIVLAAALVYWTRGPDEAEPPLVNVLRADEAGFQESLQRVFFESRAAKMLKNFTGSRMVMFAGDVTNRGDRPLDVVEVRLILFNGADPVFESTRTPIKPGPYTPPVQPGETRGFTVYLEDFPDHWLASRAEMEISGIRFEGSSGTAPGPASPP